MNIQTSDIMSKGLITILHNAPLEQAYRLMRTKNIRHLPVSDGSGRIVGLLSDRDLQRAMTPESYEQSILDYGSNVNLSFEPTYSVQDFMSFPVHVVDQKMTIEAVTEKMIQAKISSFIVVDEGRPVGIVTTEDMLKLLMEFLRSEPSSLNQTLDGFVEIWAPLN